jgi:DNA-binding MurR/RpiR family transcriptional regulator
LLAQRIVVFGLGNSAAIATDLAHKLLRVGLNAQACCDNHMQAIIASHLGERCVAVGISHSGASTDILDSLELAKMAGATTICMTNFAKTPIVELSDIVLYTRADETKRSVLAMSSRIAQLAIIDALYSYIVIHTDAGATQAIYNTESALKRKKQD